MKNKAVLIAVGLIALLPAVLMAYPAIGDPAPDFTVPDTAGTMVSLSDFHGKVVQCLWWQNT